MHIEHQFNKITPLLVHESGYNYFLLTVFLASIIIAIAVKKKKAKISITSHRNGNKNADSSGEKKLYIITDYLLGIGFWVLALASASWGVLATIERACRPE